MSTTLKKDSSKNPSFDLKTTRADLKKITPGKKSGSSIKDFINKNKSTPKKNDSDDEDEKELLAELKREKEEEEIKDIPTNYYELLGVSKTASKNEIVKAFRELQMKHHPDRGGNILLSNKISEAYNVLSNSKKRELYDNAGAEGLKELDSLPANHYRLVGLIQITKSVTLEDLYNGSTIKHKIERSKFCKTCKGDALINIKRESSVCGKCHGTGMNYNQPPAGLFLPKPEDSVCKGCKGLAKIYKIVKNNDTKKCKHCVDSIDAKNKMETVEIDIKIPAGHANNLQIIIRGEGSEYDIGKYGDVIVVPKQAKHPIYVRNMETLYANIDISLAEAICGFDKKIPFLNGESLHIMSGKGAIIKPDLTMTIEGKGMPYQISNSAVEKLNYGNLMMHFNIIFPKKHFLGKKPKLYKALKDILNTDNSSKVKSKYLEELHDTEIDSKTDNRYYIPTDQKPSATAPLINQMNGDEIFVETGSDRYAGEEYYEDLGSATYDELRSAPMDKQSKKILEDLLLGKKPQMDEGCRMQ